MQQGNWGSFGFIPSGNGSGYGSQSYHRGVGYGSRRGYGYGVGYPFFAYPGDYAGFDADDAGSIGYAANDPGYQQNAAPNGYADPAPQPAPAMMADAGAYDSSRSPYMSGSSGTNGSSWSGSSGPPLGDRQRSNGLSHPKVTLIFKDGRQPLHIQNYAMTSTKLFVRDNGQDRDIAISDLDVAATLSANDQAGVSFELPQTR